MSQTSGRWAWCNLRKQGVALRPHWPLGVLMILVVPFEIALRLHAEPNVFPDSWGYWELAQAILAGQWWHERFTFRTPGYPAFLAVVFALAGEKNWGAVITLQFFLGATMPVALYLIFYRVAGKPWIAALGAAAFLADRYTLQLQAVPLTECLGAILAAWFLAIYLIGVERKVGWLACAVGVFGCVTILVRPSFQFLAYCFALGSLCLELLRKETRRQWRRAVLWNGAMLLTMQLVLWGWMSVMYRHTGHFALSLQLGASMTNHTGAWMEYAPDAYAALRNPYVAARDKNGGNWINLYDAIDDELTSETGLRGWELSLKFREINSYLLKRFWRQYIRQVYTAWRMLWIEPSRYVVDEKAVPVEPGQQAPPLTLLASYLRSIPVMWAWLYQPLDRGFWFAPARMLKVPFVLFSLFVLVMFLRWRDPLSVLASALSFGTVVYHMLVHALVQFTEFGRYRLPVQTLWLGLLVTWIVCAAVEITDRLRVHLRMDPPPANAKRSAVVNLPRGKSGTSPRRKARSRR